MTQIAVRLDDGMVNSIEDELDNDPRFENRSQFIRYGIRVALKSEYEQSE
jgi:Arc/MetJ-type ribon-helix-helix transcriptional regulator